MAVLKPCAHCKQWLIIFILVIDCLTVDYIRNPHAVAVIDDNDFTARDEFSVDDDLYRIARYFVEYDDRSQIELEYLAYFFLRPAKLNTYLKGDIIHKVNTLRIACRPGGIKCLELHGVDVDNAALPYH